MANTRRRMLGLAEEDEEDKAAPAVVAGPAWRNKSARAEESFMEGKEDRVLLARLRYHGSGSRDFDFMGCLWS